MSSATAVNGVSAAANLISRRSFDPNRATTVLLHINYEEESGTKLDSLF
jgi:hypothetical protein